MLHLPRSRSLSLWLLERSSAAVGFGMAKESHFVTWLTHALLTEAFGAIEVPLVVENAQRDLGLEREAVLRMLAKRTAAGGEFRSDGHLITLSG